MRLNDTFAGGLFVVIGAAIVIHAQTFPPSPGQNIGPDLFPSVIGAGLALCGLSFIWSGLRAQGVAWIQPPDWIHRPRMIVNFVVVIADLIFYALVVERAGFFLTAFAFLTILFLAFGVPKRWIPVLATAVALGMHFAFYTMLHVPLPWGWLEGIAW